MKRSILFLTFLFFIFIPSTWGATPSVSNVTGTAQSGQVLTINGSNFLNENTSNWFMTASQSRCEGSSPAADGWTQNGGRYDSSVKLTGTKSMQFSISGNGGSNCPIDNKGDYVYRSPSSRVMYARGYVRYSSNVEQLFSSAAYVKMFYWMQAGVYVQPVVGGGWPSSMDVKIGANYKLLPLKKKWTSDRWYCVEAMANHSNNTVQVWVDGQSIGTYSSSFVQDPFSFLVGFVNACPVPSGTFHMWTDSVALSSQRIYPITMVEIGNSSNYSSAVKVAQPLVHADENAVQISADLSGLGSGPYYVWVTNNRQERSATYKLGSGTVGDPPPADTTKPALSITSPSNGQTVNQSTVTVSGGASDASGIKSVTVNGSTCSGTTSWSKSVSLNPGSNTITVVATDNSSNQNTTSSTIQVTYSASTPPVSDTTKPALSISSPSDGQTVNQSTVTVSGGASDASGIKSVTVNGSTCYGTTSWSRTVSLSPGSNDITVVATDNSSNQNKTTSTIQVSYSASSGGSGGSGTPTQPTSILSENWEANSLDQFNDDLKMGTFSISSSVVHGGSRALRNDLEANVHDTGWATGYFGDNPYKGGDTQDDVTLQWYTYWSPGFQFPTGQKMAQLACFESWSAGYPGYQSYSPFYLSLAAINGQYFLQLESKTSGANVERNFYQNQGATITAQTGAWTAMKVRAKLNTPGKSDGIIQMWVNGVLKLQYTNVNFRDSYTSYGWNMLMLTASASPVSTANQSMYWDDILLTSTGSSTNLLPPENLRIVSED